ncbi:hypothetical protein H131_00751 [Lysinibacillus sphaericus OT4b.31]|uniref:Uncharacterized protein n=1 Tax=Lysinibacillus sphaericus OT4b.31 TaxID=1285586 RepID=R7ZKH5_LYSSH|nr:hypothetical protein H131_00751 [Lysinibacillus sphaericus OT4b.31]
MDNIYLAILFSPLWALFPFLIRDFLWMKIHGRPLKLIKKGLSEVFSNKPTYYYITTLSIKTLQI